MIQNIRRFAPAAARNRQPILEVLQRHLPTSGLILEVASGTGEHCVYFAMNIGGQLIFQPSDPDAEARSSIDAWVAAHGLTNVRPALDLDASKEAWPINSAGAVLCINMIHIAPWTATAGLMAGAARVLPAGGVLFLYGPYHRDGRPTAGSNAAFDRDLRQRNPLWGIRDLEAVTDLASTQGFERIAVEQMPANNLSVIFAKI